THNLVLSPDGRRLAFIATKDGKRLLWLYSFDDLSPQPVAGTDGAYSPFWSPDGRYIAFFAVGTLKKVDIASAAVQTICNLSGEIDTVGSWGSQGVILFSDQFNAEIDGKSTSAIFRVAATGGVPTTVRKLDKYDTYWVQFLPNGKDFLFYRQGVSASDGGIYAASLDSADEKLVLQVGLTRFEYVAPGYLLYVREGTLLAQAFD